MKQVLMILSVLILSSCASTQLTKEQTERSYVVESSGSQTENHTKANLFIAKIFNSANNVIQMNNPESGIIVVKGRTNCSSIRASIINNPADIDFTLTVNSKKDRVRFLFEGIKVTYLGDYGRVDRNDLIISKEDQDSLSSCLKTDFVDGFSSSKQDDNW